MISIVSSKLIFSKGEYQIDIVLLAIADIKRNLSQLAIFKSDIVFGIMLRQSNILLVSMFHNFIFSLEAANKNSELSSQKVKFVMVEESIGVMLILLNCSKSQYFTVLSVDPLAKARFCGLNSIQVTYQLGKLKLANTFQEDISHILTDPSRDPEATHLESGDI